MATDYNKDAWRLVEKKFKEEVAAGVTAALADGGAIAAAIAAAVTAALADGGAIAAAIAAAVTAHEAKAEGDTFANSHVVSAAE